MPDAVASAVLSRPAPAGDRATALAGWRSRLAALVVAALAVTGVSGAWIYAAPFSAASQVVVLLHTALGLALVVPCGLYLGSHVAAWWRQKPTATLLLGYLAATVVLGCLASGLVVTWGAWAGPSRSRPWAFAHQATGLALLFALPAHLVGAWVRRGAAAARDAELAAARRHFFRAVGTLLGLAVMGAVGAAWWSPATPSRGRDVPEDYGRSEWVASFEEFGDSAFAPSHARTEHGGLVEASLLAGSRGCGAEGCHEQITREWEPSAHRFAAMNPPFLAVQREFAAERGAVEVRYCAGCHDPISLFAGAKDIHDQDLSAPGMDEGVSCVVCHTISSVDQRGNADYVLTPPHRYLWEDVPGGWRRSLAHFLIRAYPGRHLADYDRNILRAPEFCGACHKQYIPEALNRFGTSPGQNQFDEWRNSHWNAAEPAARLACRDCHMRLVHDSGDPGRGERGDLRRAPDDAAHRHHGTIATNLWMPRLLGLPGWEEQVRLTEEWIRGEAVVPEIAALWPDGPVARLHLVGPDRVAPGEEATVRVVVENVKAGHHLSTGPLDFIRCWVHVRVEDAAGRVVAEWGGIDPVTRRILDGPGRPHVAGLPRDEGALVLEGMPVDTGGRDLLRHELWRKAGGRGNRVLYPRTSDSQAHRFLVPADAAGPLRVTADLNYRRYRQDFLDLVVPGLEERSGVPQPLITKASVARTIEVAPPAAGAGGGASGAAQ